MSQVRVSARLTAFALALAGPALAAAATPPDLVRPLERDLPLSPAALEARRVLVDTRLLEAGAARLRIELPDGLVYTAVRDGLERRGPADLVWTGRLAGIDRYNRVVVSRRDDLVHALVIAPEGVYELVPAGGGRHSFERLDPAELPPCGGAIPAPPVAGASVVDAGAAAGAAARRGADGGDVIDVLALYTPEARDEMNGRAGIEAHIQFEVDKANTALADSRMSLRFRLVHTALEQRQETAALQLELETVRDSHRVARLRDEHGADLVALFAGPPRRGGSCGIAYVMRNPSPGFAPLGFSVTAVRCAGTLAHELGHNLGLEHDPGNGASPDEASYPWSFGHLVDGSYRTLMAYPNDCNAGCPAALFFSNPDVSHRGAPTGIAGQRDNARTGDLTAPVVAAFRPSVGGGLFADGFDDGSTGAWDRATGNLEVVQPGLRGSTHALQVTLDGTSRPSFVESRAPRRERRLDVGFYLRPDRVALGGAELTLLELWNKGTPHLELKLVKSGSKYRVEVYARNAGGVPIHLGGAKVRANKADRVLLEWRRATAAGVPDGSVRLRVNGRLKVDATGLDNRRWVVNRVRLGLPAGSDGAPAGGSFRLDAYASGR